MEKKKLIPCNEFNQYYTDIVDASGNIVTCFNGTFYPEQKNFQVNSYKNYKNKPFYSWINENFKEYAFPREDYDSEQYSPSSVFAKNCESKVYSLKQQQKFAARIFNTDVNTNSMLIYHGLGSGKTQTSIIIGEAFKLRTVSGKIIKNRPKTRVLIVVPAALKEQYYAEIIGKYESGNIKSATGEIVIMEDRQYYADKIVRRKISENYNEISELVKQKYKPDANQALIQRQIDILSLSNKEFQKDENERVERVYEIISHESFLNKLFVIENNKYMEKGYLVDYLKEPNGLLIIDEIQNLISATGTNYRRLLYALQFYAHPTFRVVLLTGTPIYDKPYEFGLLMNLLRPRVVFPDGRDNFNELFLQNNEFTNQESFKKMCSGYISYFKGGNPIAYPYKKTTVMLHQMDTYQYDKYKEALIKETERDKLSLLKSEDFFIDLKKEESNSGIFHLSNQVCNIAFPEITSGERRGKSILQQNISEFRKILFSEQKKHAPEQQTEKILKLVGNYSRKFATVAKMILECEGTVFVFSNFVYYGVDAMGIIMESLGYAPFPSQGARGSFFVWKGEINSKKPELVKAAKDTFNNALNKDGRLLKVMFGTQTVMEGVDFKNVNQIHLLDPWWNDARMQQIIARGIRLCSHKDLPPEKRIVSVFIHLSTLGSYEKVYYVDIIDKGSRRTVKSFMQIENIDSPKSEWYIYEAYARIGIDGVIIQNSSKTFKVSQIIENTVRKGADQSLTRVFGSYKGLDSRSVQEYMYTRALQKLNINRKFELVIKEAAIDCTINKNGNVIRLDEMYTPNLEIDNTWNLEYENYSTGEKFIRLNVKSKYKELPENVLTISDILNNTAYNSANYTFISKTTGTKIKMNKSLIISEQINCQDLDYSFQFPKEIVDLTINKELIPFLLKLNKQQIEQFLINSINESTGPRRNKMVRFLIKQTNERNKYIESLKESGFQGSEEDLLAMGTDQLKIAYEIFVIQAI